MTYKNKITLAGGIAGALALVYILSFVFDPQRRTARSAAYTWLSSRAASDVSQISIRLGEAESAEASAGAENPAATTVKLEKIKPDAGGASAAWVVVNDGKNFPAKSDWIDELLTALSKKGAYPVRSRTDSAHDKLGVTETKAKQIILSSAGGQTILDLLIGSTDSTGKRYMRKNGSSEVRSGEDALRGWGTYLPNYYDLRLFPDHDKKALSVTDVQRIIVSPLPLDLFGEGEDATAAAFNAWTLVRSGALWQVEGKADVKLDTVQTDNYVRGVLDVAADDFIVSMNAGDEPFLGSGPIPGRLIIQTGDGKERHITLAHEKYQEKRPAAVSDSPFVYSMSDWAVNQLLKDWTRLEEKPAASE